MTAPKRLKQVRLGDHALELYPISMLQSSTGLAAVTLRLWQRNKVLPPPVLKVPGGLRWYSALEITEYGALVRSHYDQGVGRKLTVLSQNLHHTASQIRSKLRAIAVPGAACPPNVARILTNIKPKKGSHEATV